MHGGILLQSIRRHRCLPAGPPPLHGALPQVASGTLRWLFTHVGALSCLCLVCKNILLESVGKFILLKTSFSPPGEEVANNQNPQAKLERVQTLHPPSKLFLVVNRPKKKLWDLLQELGVEDVQTCPPPSHPLTVVLGPTRDEVRAVSTLQGEEEPTLAISAVDIRHALTATKRITARISHNK